MSVSILSIHHASLLVSDLKKSLDFYCGVLDLQRDTSRPNMKFPGAWLTVGENQQIHLLQLPNPDPENGRPDHAGRDRHTAFNIKDIEELKTQLNHAGVPYTLSSSGRDALFCRDPDGNGLEFIQHQ
ncbi:MAG TPA: glyoxalase [Chromatiales bacterium]|nr:glyoxalase [Thiotrichales bacterium]HIP67344.1 glyoxalase [Chromatiales bacterium]